jgi:hypothetical protein
MKTSHLKIASVMALAAMVRGPYLPIKTIKRPVETEEEKNKIAEREVKRFLNEAKQKK